MSAAAATVGRHLRVSAARLPAIMISAVCALRAHKAVIALVLFGLLTRLPLMSGSIDEIDSANFVNALENGYDIPLLRPHAPGYPVYIFLGGLVRPFVGDPVFALALLSAMLGSLTVIPFHSLAREFVGPRLAVAATVLLLVNPLFWTFSESALSDVPATFTLVTFAWFAWRARCSDRFLIWAAVFASLAIGVRQANLAFLPLLVFPVVYRSVESRTVAWRSGLLALEWFTAATVAWAVPMILSGTQGLGDYWNAVEKQWRGAVAIYSIAHVDSPQIVNVPIRIERFIVGYLFSDPWVGIDARTPVTTLLQAPWVLMLAAFAVALRVRDARHMFLLLWIAGIAYSALTIHYLPRYGLPIIPPLILASMFGLQSLHHQVERWRVNFTLLSTAGIGAALILLAIKYQPPLDPFEWTPAPGSVIGALLMIAATITLLAARVVWQRNRAESDGPRSTGRSITGPARILAIAVPVGLVAVTAATGFSYATTARDGVSPNQRLVEYAVRNFDIDEVTVCWDGQTHSYFELASPSTVPKGFWTIEELSDAYQRGKTLLFTQYCVRFDEITRFAPVDKVATFTGDSPLWAKAPEISLFATTPRGDSQ